jgi:DNA-binding beta-propeller fold protein YncE
VCWQNGGGGQDAAVQLPARSDSAYIEMLAYEQGTPPNDMRQANSYGWLGIGASDRPQFVTEPTGMPISRPDLVVDSIMVPVGAHVRSVMDIHAFVRNIGSDTTPDVVALDFLCDTTAFILHATSEWRIPPGGSYVFSFEINPIPGWMHGWHLFSARVNPGQAYVERDGMDDNCGYVRRYISRVPDGELIGELYGHHSNEPLPLFRIETHDMEADTTGQTPCDSARLVQWFYGNDTVVHGGDTTAWFCANQAVSLDTSWLYLSGQGKYKLFLQVKDSWSMSELIPDTTRPFVVFDTTGPTGSVVINGGSRFTPSSTCTLRLAAHDSASGVGWMRFMNRPRVNLVSNGSFVPAAGSWGFTNGAYDTSLQMAKLSAGPSQACVRQFVPAESISAHSGDSCVLEASILALVHGGDATGDASFWYWSTRQDTSLHDTLWSLVDSALYSGDLLSLTGRYNLSTRFLLETPTPESGWVWRGGMVRVQAHGVDGGVGDVWTDNVALNAFEPGSSCAWWGRYDTLAEWNIGSTAGGQTVYATCLDSAGNESRVPFADTLILDPTSPVVNISLPEPGQYVGGTVEVTGWAYDPVEVAGDTWWEAGRLYYRHVDSTGWEPAKPDTAWFEPVYPDSGSILGPAQHLGYWNTDSVPDGDYYLLLTGTDSAGHVARCSTWVVVSNEGGGGGMRSGPEGGGSGMGEGSVYVGSATGAVLHLSDNLDSLDCFQVTDSGSQAKVTAILEVGNDSLLVLDAQNKRVHKLHKSGQHRRRLVSNLSQPMGLTKDTNGNFWLVDRGLHRIGKFRPNGTLVFIRGGLGTDSLHFHSPEGIAVKGGLVYVADTKNDRIAVWDTSGNYKATITGDFQNPTAVMVTDSGTIYLTDGNDGRLKGITPLGGNIVAIGTSDSSKLRGLVPSENKHSLFTIAAQPNKVYKFRIQSDDSTPGGQQSAGKVKLPKALSLAQPFPNPARTRLNIAYALPHQTRVVLKLYDVAGKLVATLANGEQKPGYYNLTWNRQDTKGRSCACGVYFCTLSADDKRFSRKVILTE